MILTTKTIYPEKTIFRLLVISFSSQVFSQVVPLPEIEITAVNYKYISAVDYKDLDIDVKVLEDKVLRLKIDDKGIFIGKIPSAEIFDTISNIY